MKLKLTGKIIPYLLLALFTLSLCLPASALADGETISISPKEGPVGTQVTLTSTLETPNGPFSIYWETRDSEELAEGRSAVYDVSAAFAIPEDAYGKHMVCLFDHQELSIRGIYFTILPKLSLSQNEVTPETTIDISGTGFAESDTVSLIFDGSTVTEDIATNALGSFNISFAVPKTLAGSHSLSITSPAMPGKDTPSATITIIPIISVTPEAPNIGSEVNITGHSFAASSEISLKYDEITLALQTDGEEPSPVKTNTQGSFSTSFIVPQSEKEPHVIVITDAAGNVAVFTLPLETQAPAAPAPVSPAGSTIGWFGSQKVSFDWTDVSDPSGVSYTIEVARDLGFFPATIRRQVQESQYTTEGPLEPGTYYWRVKTVDGAGNESSWTLSPHSFKVGLFPPWALILGGIVALLIVIWLIRAFIRWLRYRFSDYYY